jgi:Transposase DDE domain group 1
VEEDVRVPPADGIRRHGQEGSGEPLAIMLRPGNAGSNTAADHIEAVRLALAQLPKDLWRRVLIRADSGGGTHEFLAWLTRPARRLHYSVGFPMTDDVQAAILKVPAAAWTPAYDSEQMVRPGAWVAELTGMLDLADWPNGMRLIAVRNAPTLAPSCGSPISAGTGSRASPPIPRAGSSPTSNDATGCAPAARTLSAPPRTPACATCPCTATPPTISGPNWWPWPANSWPGSDAHPARPSPQVGTQTPAAADLHCGWAHRPRRTAATAPHRRTLALGHPDHQRLRPAPRPRARLTSHQPPLRPERKPPGPHGTPPTRRDSRALRHHQPLKQRPAAISGHQAKITKDRG